jgi:hypothetical protein
MASRKRPAAALGQPDVVLPAPAVLVLQLSQLDLLELYRRLVEQYMPSSGEDREQNFRLVCWVGDLLASRDASPTHRERASDELTDDADAS